MSYRNLPAFQRVAHLVPLPTQLRKEEGKNLHPIRMCEFTDHRMLTDDELNNANLMFTNHFRKGPTNYAINQYLESAIIKSGNYRIVPSEIDHNNPNGYLRFFDMPSFLRFIHTVTTPEPLTGLTNIDVVYQYQLKNIKFSDPYCLLDNRFGITSYMVNHSYIYLDIYELLAKNMLIDIDEYTNGLPNDNRPGASRGIEEMRLNNQAFWGPIMVKRYPVGTKDGKHSDTMININLLGYMRYTDKEFGGIKLPKRYIYNPWRRYGPGAFCGPKHDLFMRKSNITKFDPRVEDKSAYERRLKLELIDEDIKLLNAWLITPEQLTNDPSLDGVFVDPADRVKYIEYMPKGTTIRHTTEPYMQSNAQQHFTPSEQYPVYQHQKLMTPQSIPQPQQQFQQPIPITPASPTPKPIYPQWPQQPADNFTNNIKEQIISDNKIDANNVVKDDVSFNKRMLKYAIYRQKQKVNKTEVLSKIKNHPNYPILPTESVYEANFTFDKRLWGELGRDFIKIYFGNKSGKFQRHATKMTTVLDIRYTNKYNSLVNNGIYYKDSDNITFPILDLDNRDHNSEYQKEFITKIFASYIGNVKDGEFSVDNPENLKSDRVAKVKEFDFYSGKFDGIYVVSVNSIYCYADRDNNDFTGYTSIRNIRGRTAMVNNYRCYQGDTENEHNLKATTMLEPRNMEWITSNSNQDVVTTKDGEVLIVNIKFIPYSELAEVRKEYKNTSGKNVNELYSDRMSKLFIFGNPKPDHSNIDFVYKNGIDGFNKVITDIYNGVSIRTDILDDETSDSSINTIGTSLDRWAENNLIYDISAIVPNNTSGAPKKLYYKEDKDGCRKIPITFVDKASYHKKYPNDNQAVGMVKIIYGEEKQTRELPINILLESNTIFETPGAAMEGISDEEYINRYNPSIALENVKHRNNLETETFKHQRAMEMENSKHRYDLEKEEYKHAHSMEYSSAQNNVNYMENRHRHQESVDLTNIKHKQDMERNEQQYQHKYNLDRANNYDRAKTEFTKKEMDINAAIVLEDTKHANNIDLRNLDYLIKTKVMELEQLYKIEQMRTQHNQNVSMAGVKYQYDTQMAADKHYYDINYLNNESKHRTTRDNYTAINDLVADSVKINAASRFVSGIIG